MKLLVMYMVSALLFLSSIELHIHTHEAAITEDHGSAVSITSLPDNLSSSLVAEQSATEIEISPDGMLHAHQNAPNALAIFILFIFIVAMFAVIFYSRIRKPHNIAESPFYGFPSLRAPPQSI